ncbi:hypothetical protein NEMBOFW57_004503 [Staphylotrichum longicolle]|uniref:Uncharacterized protein n=1 Tax=Staphylotrichum longicolle TaxID=669026 RepID=A0AAD4F6Y5_9PEZI|nr:hypothetical protein NEMBOFW57_004503 [Staphylotrichum longicolle]
MPQGNTPRYPIQITLSSSTQQQQGSQQSQSAPVTADLNFAYPNSSSSSSSPLEARTSYYSPFDLNLDDLTSATSDSDSGSDSDSDPDDNDAFTAPKTDSDSTSSTTNTTTNTSSSSSSGPCTILLNLTSPAAHVSGAATVNIYALDGSSSSGGGGGGGGGGGNAGSPGTLVGTARFEKGAAAVVNSFACPAEGEEMGFRLEFDEQCERRCEFGDCGGG